MWSAPDDRDRIFATTINYLDRQVLRLLKPALAVPDTACAQRRALADLMMIQIAAAMCHAFALPPKAARQILAMYKRMLPRYLAVLDA